MTGGNSSGLLTMNPFDGLTKRQQDLIRLALDYMRLLSWGGENPPPKEKIEYDELLVILEEAETKD
jgi:hypothetical protein